MTDSIPPKSRERLALLLVLLILIGLPALIFGYEYGLRPYLSGHRVVTITASTPERGGFQPDSIQVAAGETVTLRFRSTDVVHGVAIGPGLGVDLGYVEPGKVKEVTLTFEQAGTYTFYCNSWCSPDHWRMRGVVEVSDPAHPGAIPTPQTDPVIAALVEAGVDIDAGLHDDPAAMPTPTPAFDLPRPSAERGGTLISSLAIPPELSDLDWRRTHTPNETIALLAATNPSIDDQSLADVAAYLWLRDSDPDQLAGAEILYQKNCAACHGETGQADGPGAETTAKVPIAFADVAYMLDRRSDVLYAKIRRGGMGTDMPNFGTLFTVEETWALVDYLWTLAFGR